jgi:alkylation response protein AidB-like acyl-CoA dehydrogenase
MDFDLSEEQRAIVAMVAQLMDEEVAPRAGAIDQAGVDPTWVRDLFRRHDLFAAMLPVEYGGIDGSLVTQSLIMEEVARVCASSSMMLGAHSLGAGPIVLAGTDQQKERWLPRLASGELIPAFGLTEPEAGSDVRSLTSRAVPSAGGWLLDGRKQFITQASVADLIVVFAKTRINGADELSAFVLETEREGFSLGRIEEKMGLRASPTSGFTMEEVWIPGDCLLGDPGDGLKIALGAMNKARIIVAAQSVGIARGAMEFAVSYSKERVQFGIRLAEMPTIQHSIADMATSIEAARSLTRAAARNYDMKSRDMVRLSGMSKVFASDVAMQVTTDAVQMLGGYGYMKDYPVERMMRDAKIFQIIDGTNQILRSLVARSVLDDTR